MLCCPSWHACGPARCHAAATAPGCCLIPLESPSKDRLTAGDRRGLTHPVLGARGCLLRLIFYADDTLAIWSELEDISTEPTDPDEFRVHVPPGTRTVEETGNLIADAVAVMPGVKGTAARAAAEAVNRTAGAVSAARSFLDDLRGHR